MSVTNIIRKCSAATVRVTNLRYTSSTACQQSRWDLVSAVCVERRPVITAEPNDLETRFAKYLQTVEYEKSFKSDYEINKESERRKLELVKKGELSDTEIDKLPKLTSQDLEDQYQEEIKKFVISPRISEADKNDDFKSLDRVLDKYLILIVKQKLGNEYKWSLPQGLRKNEETMRQAAERVLVEKCGEKLKAVFLGNAPCGFYKYKYPKLVVKNLETVGAKIFFFKAWYISGKIECEDTFVEDFRWSCSEELSRDLGKEYYKSVSQFLIDQ